MKVEHGDLVQLALEGRYDVIVHGCNCQCKMGAGLAEQIAATFPAALAADKQTIPGDVSKLGTYSSAWIELHPAADDANLLVINAYTQFFYGGGGRQVDYNALRKVFKRICAQVRDARKMDGSLLKIAYPKIGAGLGGGDWRIIKGIIDEELKGLDHTLVVRS